MVGVQGDEPFEKMSWSSLETQHTFLGIIYPMGLKIYIHTKACTQMFIAALLTIAKKLEATKMSFSR
jgi:hypothetical protein